MLKKVPFYLVTGFLGSGKTTLIKRFIECYADSKKIVVIQNEYAEVNIDSCELKQTGKSFELLEMNNGSVFCVCLLGSFVHSLSDFIHEHQPDLIILEASGLSDPISISQIISAPALRNLIWLAHTYTVVDALNFQKTIERVGRNTHQIRIADTIVLNKCDLLAESLREIRSKLLMINPFAKIVETSFGCIEFVPGSVFHLPVAVIGTELYESSGRPDVGSAVIKLMKPVSPDNLDLFIQKYSLITYRIKGYVSTTKGSVAVQTSFGQIEIKSVNHNSYHTEIVIIGPEIDQKVLQLEFENLCNQN
ncbi:MAG: CobW family GTP-binding protein [Bacteroidia bacterium]|nr:CobW family GTP-binding protein [Bacteroidia bacterium]